MYEQRTVNIDNASFKSLSVGSLAEQLDDKQVTPTASSSASSTSDSAFDDSASDDEPPTEDEFLTPRQSATPTSATPTSQSSRPAGKIDMTDDKQSGSLTTAVGY